MQLPVSDSQLAALVRLFDADEDGSIDYVEFCRAVEDATFLSEDEASTLSRSLGAAAAASGRSGRSAGPPRPSMTESVTASLRHLRSHVWNKHGTIREAWQVYHVGSAGGSMKLATLVRSCKREGYPLTMRALQHMLRSEGLAIAPLSFSGFRTLLARPAPSTAATALAMGATSGSASSTSRRSSGSDTRRSSGRVASERGTRRSHEDRGPAKTYRDYEAADPSARAPGAKSVGDMDIMATYEKALRKVGLGLEQTSYGSKRLHDSMTMSGSDGCPPHDLRRGLHRIGCDITELDAEVLVARFDEDRDGQLDFGEFLHLVREAAEAVA
jgi:Ca2+-binding EF-hand superfamily protein